MAGQRKRPNKFSVERAAKAEREHGQLPHDRLFRIGRLYETLAAQHQQIDQKTTDESGAEITTKVFRTREDRDFYGLYLDKARDSYALAAPYYAPRMSAVKLEDKRIDLSRLNNEQLIALDSIMAAAGDETGDSARAGKTTH